MEVALCESDLAVISVDYRRAELPSTSISNGGLLLQGPGVPYPTALNDGYDAYR